jgi:hypothetical protein
MAAIAFQLALFAGQACGDEGFEFFSGHGVGN